MILLGDCLEKLKELPDDSVDSVVTDPPYGWRFMGKAWDGADIEKMAKEAVGKEPRLCADGKIRKPRENCASIAAGKYVKFIGIEMSPEYVEIAEKRIAHAVTP